VTAEPEHTFLTISREPSLAEKVAESITEAIVSRRLRPGRRLDSERDLADQFGVSRNVIREAIRSLEAQGLVLARPGLGVEVTRVGSDSIARALRLYVRSNPSLDDTRLHEVRSGIEIQMAGLAAERATDENLERLETTMDELNRHFDEVGDEAPSAKLAAEIAALDIAFHREMAAATQNEFFLVMLDSIGEALLDARRERYMEPEVIAFGKRATPEILGALQARDPERAQVAMRDRLAESEAVWRRVSDQPEGRRA
jgi:DNA-binding FadR family transcriptional regulator